MGKQILILNGSPRTDGNTSCLSAAFTEGAKAAGNQVTELFVHKLHIGGCLGCFGGGKSAGQPCVQHDDMDIIYPLFVQAEVVVLASPLYYWNISGQLKTVIDRLFAVSECNADCAAPKKDVVLLMSAEGNCFEETLHWYTRLTEHLGWNNLGSVCAGNAPHDRRLSNCAELVQAQKLGAAI